MLLTVYKLYCKHLVFKKNAGCATARHPPPPFSAPSMLESQANPNQSVKRNNLISLASDWLLGRSDLVLANEM